MAWRVPPSQTTTVSLAADGDDVFIGDNIAITVEGTNAIRGFFSGHHGLIYGLVANSSGSTVSFGLSSSTDNGHLVEVKAGGHVQHLGSSNAVLVTGYGCSIVNAGLISAPSGNGVTLEGINAGTVSTVTNSGTIEGFNGIAHIDKRRLS